MDSEVSSSYLLFFMLYFHFISWLRWFWVTSKSSIYWIQRGNSTLTELQIRDFGLLSNHFVLYSYDLSQFEYFYKVQVPMPSLETQNLSRVLSCLDLYRVYTVIRLRGRTWEADQIRLLGLHWPAFTQWSRSRSRPRNWGRSEASSVFTLRNFAR